MDAALEQIGPRVRAARRERGWTLEDLASRAGMSSSTLSRLESGKRQASLALLLPLTRQLGIRIDDLLPQGRAIPGCAGRSSDATGWVIAPLTLDHSPVQTFKVTYPPSAHAPSPRVHDGYEWFYVLRGRIRLVLDDHEHIIERGEAAEFDTRMPHSLSATAQGPAEIISIFSASGERMHTHGAP